jgi:hypothetical protein
LFGQEYIKAQAVDRGREEAELFESRVRRQSAA